MFPEALTKKGMHISVDNDRWPRKAQI